MRTVELTFAKPLSESDWMVSRMVRRGGIVVEFSVSHMARISGQEYELTRFDNAHGTTPHQHVFYSEEEGRTINMPSQNVNQAFTFAQETIKNKYQKIREMYLSTKRRDI